MKGASLRKRFMWALVLFAAIILGLWFGYHTITYGSFSRGAKENAELAAGHLSERISAEFAQMKSVAEIIAASPYVQYALSTGTMAAFYATAGTVFEVIRNAAYPISLVDSIVAINKSGEYFRFSGGLSQAACATLANNFQGSKIFHTIIELDGILYFGHSQPVYTAEGHTPDYAGAVVLLTNLNRPLTALGATTHMGIDTAVIQDGIILLSSERSLEGKSGVEIGRDYGLVIYKNIAGTGLSVAAAVKNEALFPGRTLFLTTSFILLGLMLIAVVVLYIYLSAYMVKPMSSVIGGVTSLSGELTERLPETPVIGKPDFQALVLAINGMLDRTEQYSQELSAERQKLFDAELLQRNMRIGLLISQIDAHFVVNAITSIRTLSIEGDNEKAGRMADGLARIIKHRHMGDALCNLFVEFEILEQYVALMNIRHDDKFTAEYDVDDSLTTYLIPGLVLQPVVENALTHGLQNKAGKAILHIRGYMKDNSIILEVSDNGSGLTPVKLKEIQNTLETSGSGNFPEPGLSGVSLSNIQRRIRLRFGDGYGLSIDSVLGEGTTVTIILPATSDVD